MWKVSTFMSGRGDAVTVFTNNELQLLEARSPGHAYNVFRYADYGVTMLNLAIFTHNDTLAQNPQMVRDRLLGHGHCTGDLPYRERPVPDGVQAGPAVPVRQRS